MFLVHTYDCHVIYMACIVYRYELELSGGGSANLQQQLAEVVSRSVNGKRAEEEISSLHDDVRNLLRVNDGLQHNLAHMQNEITMLLKQQIGKSDGTTDGITAMLLASNEALMKELQEIRDSTSANAVAASRARLAPDSDDGSQQDRTPATVPGGTAHGSKKGGGHLPPTGKKVADRMLHATQHQGTPREAGAESGLGRSTDLNATPAKGFGMSQLQGVFTPGGNYGTTGKGAGYMSLQTPATPHGRNMLTRTLAGFNLPPEEWADEVKELNGQLIER